MRRGGLSAASRRILALTSIVGGPRGSRSRHLGLQGQAIAFQSVVLVAGRLKSPAVNETARGWPRLSETTRDGVQDGCWDAALSVSFDSSGFPYTRYGVAEPTTWRQTKLVVIEERRRRVKR
jgi:hypothetical protein